MIPLDGSIPAALLIWFQTIASAIPIRARMTVLELVFGCMLTGRGHVTQALSAITPRRGWRAYFRMLETDGFSWLDIVHALCRIVRDSFVPQDQCVIALDDTLLPRSSKKAPGAASTMPESRTGRAMSWRRTSSRSPWSSARRGGGGASPWPLAWPTTAWPAAS